MPAGLGVSRDVVPPTRKTASPQPVAKKEPWYKRLFACCNSDASADTVASRTEASAKKKGKTKDGARPPRLTTTTTDDKDGQPDPQEGGGSSSPLIVKKLEAFYETKRANNHKCKYDWASDRTPLKSDKQEEAEEEHGPDVDAQQDASARCRLKRRAGSRENSGTPPTTPPLHVKESRNSTHEDSNDTPVDHVMSFKPVNSTYSEGGVSDSDPESHQQYEIAQLPWQGQEERLPQCPTESS